MAERDMIAALQAYLDHHEIDDQIEEAGQFEPRGQTGASVAGGLIGGDVAGDAFGQVAGAIGTGVGLVAGGAANAHSRNLPRQMLVGASATTVYGFKMKNFGRKKEPDEMVFRVPREGLQVNVLARVNVRVLELVETATGAKVELEGPRLPLTHSHDLIKYLAAPSAVDDADAQAAAAGETRDQSNT